MKLLFTLFLLVPVLSYSQKGAVLFSAGANAYAEKFHPFMNLSAAYVTKDGVGIGGGFGVEHNRIFDNVALPLFCEISFLGKSDKVSPIGTLQGGYLAVTRQTRIEGVYYEYKGGVFMRAMFGVKAKGKIAPFIQAGYGLQQMYILGESQEYGTFIGVIGVKF